MNKYIDPVSQLIHSTVRISCYDSKGNLSTGTGYIYFFCEEKNNSVPCIVTNKHVVKNAVRGVFNLTLKTIEGLPDLGHHEEVSVENIKNICIYHSNPEIDLVAIPIGPILNSAQQSSKSYFFIPIDRNIIPKQELLDSLSPMEEIVMIGYPSGVWDKLHNLPVIRRGITASHPKLNLNGKPEFLIDAACFPGSSGSPVFLANIGSFVNAEGALCAGSRIALLGTLWGGPQHTTTGDIVEITLPTDTKSLAIGTIPNNLGYVIHSSELIVLEECIRARLQPPSSRNSPCPCGSGNRFKSCCGRLS